MGARTVDGSAGDADHGGIGAGTGSYEPADRLVTAVEPSASMRSTVVPIPLDRSDGFHEACCGRPEYEGSLVRVTENP